MTQAKGSKAGLVLAFEKTFGETPKGSEPGGVLMPINSSDIQGTRNLNTAATIRGDINPTEPFDGNKSISGTVVIPVDSTAIGWWFNIMFGDADTSGPGPQHKHIFKLGSDQQSTTIEHQYTDINQYEQFNGCKVNSFSMTVGGDEELTANIDIVGANFSDPQDKPFDSKAFPAKLRRLHNFKASLEEGGKTLANATEVALTIDFNLDTTNYVIGGGGVLGSIPEGIVGVSGTLTTLFEDVALLNKAIKSTKSSLKIFITGTHPSPKVSDSMEIFLPEIRYAVSSPPISGPQGILQALDFQGFYSEKEYNPEKTSIKVTLINGSRGYHKRDMPRREQVPRPPRSKQSPRSGERNIEEV